MERPLLYYYFCFMLHFIFQTEAIDKESKAEATKEGAVKVG